MNYQHILKSKQFNLRKKKRTPKLARSSFIHCSKYLRRERYYSSCLFYHMLYNVFLLRRSILCILSCFLCQWLCLLLSSSLGFRRLYFTASALVVTYHSHMFLFNDPSRYNLEHKLAIKIQLWFYFFSCNFLFFFSFGIIFISTCFDYLEYHILICYQTISSFCLWIPEVASSTSGLLTIVVYLNFQIPSLLLSFVLRLFVVFFCFSLLFTSSNSLPSLRLTVKCSLMVSKNFQFCILIHRYSVVVLFLVSAVLLLFQSESKCILQFISVLFI